MQAPGRWDVRERLGEVSAPTFVIRGDWDRPTAPDQSCRLRDGIQGSRLCIVPGCAHNVHRERQELFSAIVLDFLAGGVRNRARRRLTAEARRPRRTAMSP